MIASFLLVVSRLPLTMDARSFASLRMTRMTVSGLSVVSAVSAATFTAPASLRSGGRR